MTTLEKVDIGGLEFFPEGTSGLIFETLVDWDSVPDSKSEIRERPASDGAFGIDEDWRQSLALSLEGHYLGSDVVDAALAKRELRRVLAVGRSLTIAATGPLGVTTREVSIRRVSIPDDRGFPEWDFAVDMIAFDSNQYGPEFSSTTGLPVPGTGAPWPPDWDPGYDWGSGGDPGRVSATNEGTATTYPVLEVVGGLDGVELVEVVTGSVLRLERVIPVTSTAFFDTRTGRVFIDIPANDVSGFLVRREWPGFAMPAGATRTVQLNSLGGATGTPTLTIRYSPAY